MQRKKELLKNRVELSFSNRPALYIAIESSGGLEIKLQAVNENRQRANPVNCLRQCETHVGYVGGLLGESSMLSHACI